MPETQPASLPALGKLADAVTRRLERATLAWNPAYRTA